MLDKDTVLVIGAGASKEFGLPIGSDLQETIAESLNLRFQNGVIQSGNADLWEAIQRASPKRKNEMFAACRRIRDGLPLSNSIDNFMDAHRHDTDIQTVGRLAIAHSISRAERASNMFVPFADHSGMNFKALGATWIVRLFRLLQEGVRRDQLGTFFEKISFVVFNYDRCIEHFFHRALQSMYALEEKEASKLLRKARILHTYGTIGALPWQVESWEANTPFGAEHCSLDAMVEKISTYTDPHSDEETRTAIRDAIARADRICFLGFSFQQQNLDLITPRAGTEAGVIGTAFGMSEFNVDEISTDLISRFETPTSLSSDRLMRLERTMSCADLVSAYSRAFV
jgi:hypothetical protein